MRTSASSPTRVAAMIAGVFVLAGAVALSERRILSGLWLEPRFPAERLRVERVHGASVLTSTEAGRFEPIARALDSPACDVTPACEDARARLRAAAPGSVRVRDIDAELWSRVAQALVRDRVIDDRPSHLGEPAVGWALDVERAGQRELFVHLWTREIEQDWYREVEAVYRVGDRDLRLLEQTARRYEIAGFEAIELPHLWLLNALIILLALVVRRTQASERRPVRFVGRLVATTLIVLGIALVGVVLRFATDHDPWLAVLLVTGVVLVIAGASGAVGKIRVVGISDSAR